MSLRKIIDIRNNPILITLEWLEEIPMKLKTIALLLMIMITSSLLFGCSPQEIEQKLEAMEDSFDQRIDQIERDAEENIPAKNQYSANYTPVLTPEEAQDIALKHAGFTADQLTNLYSDLDFDEGIHHYDVHFYRDTMEYEYEINADTGEIISFEKDN